MTIILRRPLLAPPMRLLAVGLALLLAVGATVAGATLLSRLLQLPAVVTLDHPRGLIAFERDGAVWTYDPETAATERIVDDAWAPVWSPDGRSLFFWRLDGARDMPMVLDMTTSDATPVALADTSVFLPDRLSDELGPGRDGGRRHHRVRPAARRIPPRRGDGHRPAGHASRGVDRFAGVPARDRRYPWADPALPRSPHGHRTTLEMIGSVGEQTAPSTVLSTDRIDTSVGPLSPWYCGEYDLLDPAVGATGDRRHRRDPADRVLPGA